MATMIDELVVALDLDPAKFNKKQREALDNFRKTQGEFVKGGNQIETSAARSIDMVGGLQRAAVGLFAVFAGTKSVIDFTTGLVRADAELGRVTRSTGVSTREISRWQGAARIFGGTAEQMAGNITNLSDAFQGLKLGEISPTITLLRSISTAGGRVIDVNHGVSQSLVDIAANIEAIEKKNPGSGGMLLRRLGLDPGTIDLLLSGEQTVRRVLALTDRLRANQGDTDAARAIQQRLAVAHLEAENAGRKALNGDNGQGGASSVFNEMFDVAHMSWGDMWKYLNRTDRQALRTGQKKDPNAPGGDLFASKRVPFTSAVETEQFIRIEAVRNGINPDVAVKVWESEGKNGVGLNHQSTVMRHDGTREESYGPFQLYMRGGLGNKFQAETGFDPRDPSTEREQIKFALAYAAKHGWGDWHGWRGARFAGIGQQMPAGGSGTTIDITVNGGVNVQAGPNAGGAEAGEAARAALTRQANAAQSNYGQQ